MSKPIALYEIKNFLGRKIMVNVCWANEVQLMEHLINTLEYKYYKDKKKQQREDKNNMNIIDNDNNTNSNKNKLGLRCILNCLM